MSRTGRPAQVIRHVYSSTNVTTSAWVEIEDATSGNASELEVFDSSGRVMKFAIGASGSEAELPFHSFPGGIDPVAVFIPKNSRLSVKAVDASATDGQLIVNLYA